MKLKELLKKLADCNIAVKIEMDHSMMQVRTMLKPNTLMGRPAVYSYYGMDLDGSVKLNLSSEEWLRQVLLYTVREMKDYCEKYHYRYESEMLEEILENETNESKGLFI